jgi:hypothetical protein
MSKAREVLRRLRMLNPSRRFELADSGNAIGVWTEKGKKFVTCSVMTIVDEKWIGHIGPEIKANGKRVYTYRKATKK